MQNQTSPLILTFGSADPVGATGIQADLATFAAMGCHGLSIITSILVSDTARIEDAQIIDIDWVADQARVILEDMPVAAFKVGAVGSIENISAYVDYNINEMTEGEFFTQLAKSTGCGILLDVNNLFVNSFNFNRNLEEELFDFPFSSVTQIHIAGHTICDDYLFDTHDKPVCHEVINLLKIFLLKNKFKNIPLILECDDNETSAKQLSEQWESIKRHVQS